MNLFEQGLQRYLSPDDLKKIRAVTTGIGGAGGLGSNIAVALVRSGFRKFKIIDSDTIVPSDLNRQFYFLDDIDAPKVLTLKKHLAAINPDIVVETALERWDPHNARDFFRDCDVIVEAFDKTGTKKSFVEYYQDKTPWVVSGIGMAGTNRKDPITVKKAGNIFFVGDRTSDVDRGLFPLAPRVMTCAAMMAEIILDLTLDGKIRPSETAS